MSTESEKSREVLARAVDQVERALAAVPSDHLDDATPCRDWTVSDLIAHLVIDPQNFLAMAKGESPDWSDSPPLPEDWTAAFRAGADDLLQWWVDAGDEAAPESMDWQTAEFAVHTWDLVQALDLGHDLDQEVAQRGLSFMGAALTPENRGAAFGPPVDIDDGAPVYDRLVAVAGRDPA